MQSHFKEKVLERLRKIKGRLHVAYMEFKDLKIKFNSTILPFLEQQNLKNDPDIKKEISQIKDDFRKINEMAIFFNKISEVFGKDYEIEKVNIFKE